jgi:general secretion pathway protein A
MYTQHFGLTDAPFTIAPNPQYLYMSKRHRDALAHLLYGVNSDGGFILLTGEVGTGKTTLCRCLLEQVSADVETAFVLNPRVTANELLETICDEFSIAYPDNASLKILVDSLNDFLLNCHQEHRKAVLIIDEAQNLSRDLLEQLRLLTNLETNERKLLQIVLLGQPELLDMLAEQNLRQFSQRITARYHLEALNQPETMEYVRHRLTVADGDPSIFSNSALKKVYQLSSGIPRVINLICDRALLGAYAEDRKLVNSAIVNKAATEVLGAFRTRSHKQLGLATLLIFVSAIGIWASIEFGKPKLPDFPVPVVTTITSQSDPETAQLTVPAAAFQPVAGHDNITAAYHDLFAVWGTAFEDKQANPCDLASTIGLKCHQQQTPASELANLNRPAIITIDNQFFTLSSINDGRFTLIAGDKQVELAEDEFSARYSGDITLFWRMPPAYESPLKIKDTGAAVDWLAVQLSVIEGIEPELQTGFVYSESMEAKVRNFQVSVGILPNGIVDPLTWIHINNVEAISIPTLLHRDRS